MMETVLLLALTLTIVLVCVVLYSMIRAGLSFAPWVPSNMSMVRQALDYLKPTPDMRFVDLGCGDGRIVRLAHKRYGLHATGYEISLLPYALARLRQMLTRYNAIVLRRKNLYSVDLSQFNIIYLYGLPETIEHKLQPKLDNEVRDGAYIISYNFSLKNRRPIATFHRRWRRLFIYQF